MDLPGSVKRRGELGELEGGRLRVEAERQRRRGERRRRLPQRDRVRQPRAGESPRRAGDERRDEVEESRRSARSRSSPRATARAPAPGRLPPPTSPGPARRAPPADRRRRLRRAAPPAPDCRRQPAAAPRARRRGGRRVRRSRTVSTSSSPSAWKRNVRQRERIVGSRRLGAWLTARNSVFGGGSSRFLRKALAALRFRSSAASTMMTRQSDSAGRVRKIELSGSPMVVSALTNWSTEMPGRSLPVFGFS